MRALTCASPLAQTAFRMSFHELVAGYPFQLPVTPAEFPDATTVPACCINPPAIHLQQRNTRIWRAERRSERELIMLMSLRT
jgi:hypothetical protein